MNPVKGRGPLVSWRAMAPLIVLKPRKTTLGERSTAWPVSPLIREICLCLRKTQRDFPKSILCLRRLNGCATSIYSLSPKDLTPALPLTMNVVLKLADCEFLLADNALDEIAYRNNPN